MGWVCVICMFINDVGLVCGVCLMFVLGLLSFGDVKWICEVCIFENIGEIVFCEMCDIG